MNELPRRELAGILATHGPGILADPRRIRSLLEDRCGDHQAEIWALLAALEESVPQDLQRSSEGGLAAARMEQLAQRLQSRRALAPEAARWAVASWGEALGVGAGAAAGPVPPAAPGAGAGEVERTVARPPAGTPPPPGAPPWTGGPPGGPTPPPGATPAPPGGRQLRPPVVIAAAAVAAVVAVMIVLMLGGGDGGPPTTTTSPTSGPTTVTTTTATTTTTPGTAGPVTAAQQVVLDRVPRDLWPTCEGVSTSRFPNAPAIVCDPNPRLRVWYYQLPNEAALEAELDRVAREREVPAGFCGDNLVAFTGTSTYNQGGREAGRLVCYVDSDGDPWIEWTNRPLRIYTVAVAAASDDKLGLKRELFNFWRDDAGPS
jgi:hypothetical protein